MLHAGTQEVPAQALAAFSRGLLTSLSLQNDNGKPSVWRESWGCPEYQGKLSWGQVTTGLETPGLGDFETDT